MCFDSIIEPYFGLWEDVRYIQPADNSLVTGQYYFRFDVASFRCSYPVSVPFTAQVLVNGEQIHDPIAGSGHCSFSLPISTAGMDIGDLLSVQVVIDGWDNEDIVEYIVDGTPVQPTSFSTVKSMY